MKRGRKPKVEEIEEVEDDRTDEEISQEIDDMLDKTEKENRKKYPSNGEYSVLTITKETLNLLNVMPDESYLRIEFINFYPFNKSDIVQINRILKENGTISLTFDQDFDINTISNSEENLPYEHKSTDKRLKKNRKNILEEIKNSTVLPLDKPKDFIQEEINIKINEQVDSILSPVEINDFTNKEPDKADLITTEELKEKTILTITPLEQPPIVQNAPELIETPKKKKRAIGKKFLTRGGLFEELYKKLKDSEIDNSILIKECPIRNNRWLLKTKGYLEKIGKKVYKFTEKAKEQFLEFEKEKETNV